MIIDTHEHCFGAKARNCWAADRMPEFEKMNIKFAEISINHLDIDDMVASVVDLRPCLGVVLGEHPKLVNENTDIDEVFNYVANKVETYKDHVLGIKTGLDYYWVGNEAARAKQVELLKMFIEYADEKKLPVVLHTRAAEGEEKRVENDLLGALAEKQYTGKMVVHCFNGNKEFVTRLNKQNGNSYFGIGGSITYPETANLAEAVKIIPENRILLETDGPFVKPFYPDMTRPAGKRNTSLNLPIVIDKLSEIQGVSAAKIEEMTALNAAEFYGINLQKD